MTVLEGHDLEPSARLRPDGRLLGALDASKTGVAIDWDKRSLQDFESFPVEELARAYDLIVIDHPHVGQITGEGCLAPLDVPGRETERAALAKPAASARPIRATLGRAGNGRSRSTRRRRCRPGAPDLMARPGGELGRRRRPRRRRARCCCRCARRIR